MTSMAAWTAMNGSGSRRPSGQPRASPVRILLATDAASEGIDLQNHCHRLIHFEIPWNPNRLEQRNGRIDRHGQRTDPLIYHFARPATASGRSASESSPATSVPRPIERPVGMPDLDLTWIPHAGRQKVEQIREDLGRVGPVIAEQVRKRCWASAGVLQTDDAEAGGRAGPPHAASSNAICDARIERLHEQLHETRHELALEPREHPVGGRIALGPGRPTIARRRPSRRSLARPSRPAASCPVFHVPPLTGPSWAR